MPVYQCLHVGDIDYFPSHGNTYMPSPTQRYDCYQNPSRYAYYKSLCLWLLIKCYGKMYFLLMYTCQYLCHFISFPLIFMNVKLTDGESDF